MFSRVLAFIILSSFFSVIGLAKNAARDSQYVVPLTSGPVFFQNVISPILQAIQSGNVSVSDSNCMNPSYSQNSNLLTATVSGQNYYLIIRPAIVNGANFNPSICQQTVLANGATELDCAANELNPAAQPGSTLPFSMQYAKTGSNPDFYTIYKCPHVGQ